MSVSSTVSQAQQYMAQDSRTGLGGWLIHDNRHSNPVFWQAVGGEISHVTRPCFLFVPDSGDPTLLAHHVDVGRFTSTGLSSVIYRDRKSMLDALKSLLPSGTKVAMEYSPMATLPRVSKVDAGTIEMLTSLSIEIVSSADLVQYSTQRWNEAELSSHKRAAEHLGRIVLQAFEYIGQNLSQQPTEFQVAEFIRMRFSEAGLRTLDGPIVAVNAHASDPHYEPASQGSSLIRDGDWVLIDLWAKELAKDSAFADITWMGYVGDLVPKRHQEVFQVVASARDMALEYLESSARRGEIVQGLQVDWIAREHIASHGYDEYFTHRLGHSISHEVHGDAVNLDGFETEDTRSIIPGICFSIEPGIYLPEFGVRSEIDVYMSEEGPYATTPIQREVVLIRP